MTPTILQLSKELTEIYQEQYERYWSLYEKKEYLFFDYLEVSCEQIIYTITNYIEPSQESKMLLVKYEGLLALIKLALERNIACKTKEGIVNSQQRSTKHPLSSVHYKKKNSIF